MLSGDLILVRGPDYIVYCVQSAGHPLGRVIGYFVKILSVITSDIWTEWPHNDPICKLHLNDKQNGNAKQEHFVFDSPLDVSGISGIGVLGLLIR